MLDERHKPQFIATWQQLVRIPSRSSPTGGEEGVIQEMIAGELRRVGARVRIFTADEVPGFRNHPLCHGPQRDYGNRPTVIAEMGPPAAPALLIAAHADTVQLDCTRPASEWMVDPFGGEIRDGNLFGLGSGDDKWGLATMLTLARTLGDKRSLTRRVIFASTIDEEHGVGNGMLLLMLAGVQAEMCLYLDGGEGDIAIGLLGGSNLILRPAAPLSAATLDEHAARLEALARQLSAQRVGLFDIPLYRENHVRERSVGFRRARDAGGEFFRLPFYTLPGEARAPFSATLEEAVRGALGADAACYHFSYREPWFEATRVPLDAPVVRLMAAAWRCVVGREAKFNTSSKQDSFILNNYARIPTVGFGAARFTGYGAYHQPDENVSIDFGWQCCQVVHEAMCLWLAGKGG